MAVFGEGEWRAKKSYWLGARQMLDVVLPFEINVADFKCVAGRDSLIVCQVLREKRQ